jgi:PAS domain-containing protein
MPLLEPRNIEEPNRANANLRISEQQQRLLADNAPDMITIWHDCDQTTHVSPSIKSNCGDGRQKMACMDS